jgi:acyl transferase domain-containing protein
MEERLAMIVGSIKELEKKLKDFIEGQNGIPDLYGGGVKRNKDTISILAADEDMPKIIDAWIAKGKFKKLLDMWVKGLNFDWNKLYGDIKPSRLSLPTYPFAKERYWVPENKKQISASSLFLQKDVQFDYSFYDQLFDDVINNTISVDSASQKVINLRKNKNLNI